MSLRTAVYARYSSDQQSASSIQDQFRICREQAARDGWQIVGTYQDAAISGASLTLRPGIQALLQDAQARKIDIVLAEALDRLSRDQADTAILHRQLQFAGVKIITLAEGEISELHVGLKGTMNALFLKDLAAKTHRGLRGRVEKGKAGGGLCFGYDVIKELGPDGEPVRGGRRINEAEAATVRRIFQEFARGVSPRTIAANLNKDGVPGPNGKLWGDTTIRGHAIRGTGTINNEIYVGTLVWNKVRYIKDPATGKRVPRLNPESAWIRTEVPELRIVDDELWQAVRQRQQALAIQYEPAIKASREAHANRLNDRHRPSFLLSGLLKCARCGDNYGIITYDRYGCLNRYRRGTCENSHTVKRQEIEARVLNGLRHNLVSPEAVETAIRNGVELVNRSNRELRARQMDDRQALAKVQRGIDAITAAVEDGLYQPSMKARLADLEQQKTQLAARLSEAPAVMPDIHPNVAGLYARMIERLTTALEDDTTRSEAMEAIRSLIDKVVITPGARRGEVQAELHGKLAEILNATTRPAGAGRVVITSVDAGAGFEPAAFRL